MNMETKRLAERITKSTMFAEGHRVTDKITWSSITNTEEDAELIAEAFNVTNQCGYTPKELLEQRNELVAVLSEFFKSCKIEDVEAKHGAKYYVGSKGIPSDEATHRAFDAIKKYQP